MELFIENARLPWTPNDLPSSYNSFCTLKVMLHELG